MSRKYLFSLIALLALATLAVAQAAAPGSAFPRQPVLTFTNQGPGPGQAQLLVQTAGPLTKAQRSLLGRYGTIVDEIPRYRLVAMVPKGRAGARALAGLSFVQRVETDQPRWLTGVGTWDRDILDVVDVGNNPVGDPDAREVSQTGAGVHVAVIDSGLIKRWRAFLNPAQVDTNLARAFMGGGAVVGLNNISNPTNLWERDTNSHGTAVASHILGFKIGGFAVDGTAPDATLIPLKVFPNGEAFAFTSHIVAAIAYVIDLKQTGVIGPTVINMSLGGGAPSFFERVAIDDAIAHGIIVVASAGNAGENGMGWPGAFPEVISAGATGWVYQFIPLTDGVPNNAFWINLDVPNDPDGSFFLNEADMSFVATFSSRAIPALSTPFGVAPQQLDVLAPGLWTVAPCLLHGATGGTGNATYCFWAGTSFSSPLTAGVAALMLEKDPALTQADVESIMKATALPMAANDGRTVYVPIGTPNPTTWDTTCRQGLACDPVGAGLLQADSALAATP